MSQIKAYHDVDPENIEKVFDVKRMEDIYDITKGKADAPHRHDYYTILLVISAKGKHIIDFNEFKMTGGQVYFLSPGQVHQIVEEEKSIGYIFTFSSDFIINNGINPSFIEDLHLFQLNGYSPPLDITTDIQDELISFAEYIIKEVGSTTKFTYYAVGSWLRLFLIRCQENCTRLESNTQLVHTSQSILKEFKFLLNGRFKMWHKVNDYASHMYITSDHLNANISQLTGQSAKVHIQNRIILEAKRLLLYSDMNTKEIGYELGFKEPSHFSQFFKKCVLISPTGFIKSK